MDCHSEYTYKKEIGNKLKLSDLESEHSSERVYWNDPN